jgi:hypothetical protein
MAAISCREWNSRRQQDASTLAFKKWVPEYGLNSNLDMTNAEDVDCLLLWTKPSQKAARYTKMVSFRNHWRIDDGDARRFQTYNSGVASVFEVLV